MFVRFLFLYSILTRRTYPIPDPIPPAGDFP